MALVDAVDDISGEHGRNISHATHQFGTDIDMYHFYRFPDATSGADNYNRLRQAVITAFNIYNSDGTLKQEPPTDALEANARISIFASQTRNGLLALANLQSVDRLYYALGSAGSGLPNGWARTLIEAGRVTRTSNGVTMALNLGLANWGHAKIDFNAGHNSHIHIRLNPESVGE